MPKYQSPFPDHPVPVPVAAQAVPLPEPTYIPSSSSSSSSLGAVLKTPLGRAAEEGAATNRQTKGAERDTLTAGSENTAS
ncbi:hypothetical protein CEP54_000893 [Fusarium duplospermum]|uniref:Uncharacterized protein n=1 Tax=Fusarium duplospermum TaxID=1325734 RepID=A0A428R448_9HYPO|nr:hypothetical protein CEP54_000893 [Fusarium duplospermum]